MTKVAIIGGGAAGCFAAIHVKRFAPQAEVTVYEGGIKLLAKVAITGGGRCNLTNSFRRVRSVEEVYPRGARLLKRLLKEFSPQDTYEWFEREGVKLVTQEDECVFPQSQDAMEIVNTLIDRMREAGVRIKCGHRVRLLERDGDSGFTLRFADERLRNARADVALVTTGGSPKSAGLSFLAPLSLEVVTPVPSLFSLCLPRQDITQMMGTVVEDACVSIVGTKWRASGALLITHWGMSGPAVLRLSSYAARWLSEHNYAADLSVNWLGTMTEGGVRTLVDAYVSRHPQKLMVNVYPEQLNRRLWTFLLAKTGARQDRRWGELGGKSRNRLVAMLTNDTYAVAGKNRFKDEFVTCGGVALSNINPSTMECKTCGGLYFAGEVLDVDAVTGGFNLQAAWTMARVAAKAISEKKG